MGSRPAIHGPYGVTLSNAHGMGVPVEDASTTISFPESVHIMYMYVPITGLLPGMMAKDQESSL